MTRSLPEDINLWHYRLGHLGVENINLLTKGLATKINIPINNTKLDTCEHCLYGQQHKLPFTTNASRASKVLELIHTDICGPMNHQSLGGMKYFITFIDDMTRMTFVYFLQSKDQAFDKFKEFKALVENQHKGNTIKRLRSDNGGEYTSNTFKNYLKAQGIQHETTVPYTPQQNNVSERANRTIVERARSMLHASGLGYDFWAEAIYTTVYLKNRSPTKALTTSTTSTTPYEV